MNFNDKIKNTTYTDRCDGSISAHQRGYYIFLMVLTSEIKGFTTLVNAHMLRAMLREAAKGELKFMLCYEYCKCNDI